MSQTDAMLTKFCQETGIDATIALRLLDAFLNRIPADLDQVEATMRQENLILAGRQAHALKGTSANLRLSALAELAYRFEQAIQSARLDDARAYLDQLRIAVASITADRQAYQG